MTKQINVSEVCAAPGFGHDANTAGELNAGTFSSQRPEQPAHAQSTQAPPLTALPACAASRK